MFGQIEILLSFLYVKNCSMQHFLLCNCKPATDKHHQTSDICLVLLSSFYLSVFLQNNFPVEPLGRSPVCEI